MAKIGTAQIEIKPVLNEEALVQITALIEEAVRKGVEAGMKGRPMFGDIHVQSYEDFEAALAARCKRPGHDGIRD